EISQRPIKLDNPAGFNGELREFQKEGLAFLMHNRRALLADSMGLGKTVIALSWLAQINQYPVLIVVPPHLVKQWESETKKFLNTVKVEPSENNILRPDNELTYHTITGLTPYSLPKAHIYFIHYLLLRGWKDPFQEMDFKAIVFDEIQELRHAGTQKYSVASLVSEKCENVIGLSGTPIYNRGGEIWNILNILEFHCLGDWESFTREWCYGYGSDTVVDPELLGKYLKEEGLLLRRTKEEVLSELPPKRRIVQEIDADEGMYQDLIGKAVEIATEIPDVEDVFLKGRMMREAVNETRRITGIAKAHHVAQFVKLILEAGEPCLLFAHHHDVVDIYLKELAEYFPGCITGRENLKEKDWAVKNFMEERTNLLIISLRAATGLNLPRARAVVFGELDWSPAVHSQSEDRAHRIGTKDSVLCYYLVCGHGTDADMMEALGFKISQFVGIMGDKEETEAEKLLGKKDTTEFMKNVLEKLRDTKVKAGNKE
ncbi:ATP-dependent helicase, partial [Candidatus Poribacteria bacterium]|nr:ATP-dependent helicase [Candidatus Poribacteria bacterium]